MLLSELASADVAILGAGREGLSVRRWVRRRFPAKALTFYTESPLPGAVRAELVPDLDHVVEGRLQGEALRRHEVLVRSPGITPYRPALEQARRHGVAVTSATALWFAAHPDARTLCITGTKGKSTTAVLTEHLLRAAGMTVQLAGNIGVPLLDCAAGGVDWWVVELSSYQLADLEGRPTLGVVLNLSDEHLDWHGGPERYRRDKLRLVDLLAGNPLVACHSDRELRGRLARVPNVHWFDRPGAPEVRADGLWLGDREILAGPLPALPGQHNLRNLAAALTAARLAGGAAEPRAALREFIGLPHRLQRLGHCHGVSWVNDSLATTPVATLAALDSLAGEPVTLLLGGQDRGLDWSPAIARLAGQPPHAIVTMPDSGPALAARLRASGVAPRGGLHQAADLAEAVDVARRVTPAGGTVLLSPGAPSFPRFRDYADRGEQFARLAGLESTEGRGTKKEIAGRDEEC